MDFNSKWSCTYFAVILILGHIIQTSPAEPCTADTCHSVKTYRDIMDVLERLSVIDLDRICIELVDGTNCNMLRRDNKMSIQHIAHKYFLQQPEVYWEDLIAVIEEKFENRRLAMELKRSHVTVDDSSYCSADGCDDSQTPDILDIPKKQEEKATVLLIGSNGNGKSSLGNYLLDPFDEQKLTDRDMQYFKTSTDLQPLTDKAEVKWEQVSYSTYDSRNLTVIDTPGLNDVKDFENMIFLMKKLQDIEEINTCIVVVKFDRKIDNHYKETLKYYSRLLPDLFKGNLVVVVTHFFQDDLSKTRRKKQSIDEEAVQRNILDTVRSTCNLPFHPMIFMIDSIPVKGDNVSQAVRDKILEYVFSQEPVTPQFKVGKPHSIRQRDESEYDKLVQKATQESLQTYSDNPTLQNERDEMEDTISSIKAEKRLFENKRDELDTEELVDYVIWNTKKSHEWTRVPSDTFHLSTSPFKIRNIIKSGSQEVHWKREERTNFTYSGKVVGERFHGFRAQIVLQVYKREKFTKEIENFSQKIQEVEKHLSKKMQERSELFAKHEEIFKNKRDKLIEKARQQYKYYLDEYMTPEEAIRRLQEIKSS